MSQCNPLESFKRIPKPIGTTLKPLSVWGAKTLTLRTQLAVNLFAPGHRTQPTLYNPKPKKMARTPNKHLHDCFHVLFHYPCIRLSLNDPYLTPR